MCELKQTGCTVLYTDHKLKWLLHSPLILTQNLKNTFCIFFGSFCKFSPGGTFPNNFHRTSFCFSSLALCFLVNKFLKRKKKKKSVIKKKLINYNKKDEHSLTLCILIIYSNSSCGCTEFPTFKRYIMQYYHHTRQSTLLHYNF